VASVPSTPRRLSRRGIRGIGFKTADAIAMKVGIEKTAMIRVRAGISYALTEAMDEGHCGLPTDALLSLAVELLGIDQGKSQGSEYPAVVIPVMTQRYNIRPGWAEEGCRHRSAQRLRP
jgi:hypothetical protein